MDARSALLDLYEEHLLSRGGAAPVAALVRMMSPLGIAAPAVRTAVSRMARQGWLVAVRVDGAPGYALSARGVAHVAQQADRRALERQPWDGRWHLLVVSPPGGRAARERLATGLRSLGYGSLGESGRAATWISPRVTDAADSLLVTHGARAERFTARHDGDSQSLIARAWDLEALGRAYRRFLDQGDPHPEVDPADDEAAFARRALLVREWQTFTVLEPGLPPALLPPDWPGGKAGEWFRAELARLTPGAARFVEACLRGRPE